MELEAIILRATEPPYNVQIPTEKKLCKPNKLQEQLSPADAELILGSLPEWIRAALIVRAAEIEYLIEAVIKMAIAKRSAQGAIASFLDTEALGFADYKPGRGQ